MIEKGKIFLESLLLIWRSLPDTFEELDGIQTIKNVVVESYQFIQHASLNHLYFDPMNFRKIEPKIGTRPKRDDIDEDGEGFDYIIFEENHYVLTDATFNNLTRIIRDNLIVTFHPKAVKIFISATPQETDNYIKTSIYEKVDKSRIHDHYTTGNDFSYLNTHYFKDIDDMITTIANDQSEDKWVVFVSSIKVGRQFQKALGDKACLITHDTAKNNDNEDLLSIIQTCTFNKKVLITTRLLDNGVNLKDPAIKHMVIMEWDEVVFLQMVGRRRVDINAAEMIDLYIPMRSKLSFSQRLTDFKYKAEQVDLYILDYNTFCREYDANLKKFYRCNTLFYRQATTKDYGEWGLNEMASLKLDHDIATAERIQAAFGGDGKKKDEFAFIKEQLKWLGLSHTFDKTRLIKGVDSNEGIETLRSFLVEHVDKKLFKEGKERLTQLIISELVQFTKKVGFREYRTKTMQAETVDTLVHDELRLPYRIIKNVEMSRQSPDYKKRYWQIVVTAL